MSAAAAPGGRKTSRVWVALAALPLVLASVFLLVGAYFVGARGLQGDDVRRAIEAVAAVPASLGFAAALALTVRLARKDGLSLADLGWRRPSGADLAAGLGAAVALAALNAWVFSPLVRAAQPSFDPTVPNAGVLETVVMLSIAIAAEDTLYRGYALPVLRERHGTVAAVAVTSLFYAFLTPGPELPLKLWALGFGVVHASVRLWRDTLWPVILVHGVVSLSPKLLAQL